MFVSLVVLVHADQVLVYEKASSFGTVLVTDENGLRVLRFERGGARQTVVKLGDPDHLELPYARVAMVSLALCDEPRRILVVGLGGGSLPMFLRKHYPTAEIDAVDIDPEVVYVAKRYFDFREDGRMRAHVGDGREFIERYRQPYDVIFLDAFSSDSVPAHLTTVCLAPPRSNRNTRKPLQIRCPSTCSKPPGHGCRSFAPWCASKRPCCWLWRMTRPSVFRTMFS
jgi:spermidine synthase